MKSAKVDKVNFHFSLVIVFQTFIPATELILESAGRPITNLVSFFCPITGGILSSYMGVKKAAKNTKFLCAL